MSSEAESEPTLRSLAIPRLPVLGWHTFAGKKDAPISCLLDRPSLNFTTSGRAAILLAMEMLGVRNGDRVLVPTYHCPTMVAPVAALGAEPVFYPINEEGAPDINWLQRIDVSNVRVLLTAHYFGFAQPLGQVRKWCDESSIAMLEDCAHTLFGACDGQGVGSLGDIAIGSLTKFYPVPEGGCLVVNKATDAVLPPLRWGGLKVEIRAALDMVEVGASFARFPGWNALLEVLFGSLRAARRLAWRSEVPAAKSRLRDGFTIDITLAHRALSQSCVWIAQHAPRHRIVERRRRNFAQLHAALSGFAEIRPLRNELPAQCAPYVFPLWVACPDPGYAELRRRGIPVSRWDRVWDGVPPIAADKGLEWSHHVLQLGCHQDLSESDVDDIVHAVRHLYVGLDGARSLEVAIR